MLDFNCEPDVAAWIDAWPCYVKIPEQLSSILEQRGPTPTLPGEERRHVRMRCASVSHRAAMRCTTSLPSLAREVHWNAVYPLDIARKGCGFLHFEQLFPGERCELLFRNGMRADVFVKWCRRIDENCFAIGSQFIDAQEAPAAAN
jgi:hypothetical protein